jgi:UDP-N-acetylglucosamine 2-epimerase (non-hydrolysing)
MFDMKLLSVVGARPNFMKIAPFIRAIERHNNGAATPRIDHVLVHTGQHYDDMMSRAFFESLALPEADINLGIGSGTHAEQVGLTMMAFEKVLRREKPDWVVVVGDVNATIACSVTAAKECIPCCHIEAGLRSGDMTMPEEVNRLVTDRLSDLLLTPDELSSKNLRLEGISEQRIRFVGNIMIDTLETQRCRAEALSVERIVQDSCMSECSSRLDAGVLSGDFAVITLHRPSNVDDRHILEPIVRFLCAAVAGDMPVIWPLHPRTEQNLKSFGLWDAVSGSNRVLPLTPVGYHEMLRLNMGARIMFTDSGGLQEECCVLGTPCLTLRRSTERPVTLKEYGGSCVLVGNGIETIRQEYVTTLQENRTPMRPPLWDGRTAERIVQELLKRG